MMEQFGDRLKIAIKNSGLTQKELAKRLGICQDTITNYTKGTIPRADILYRISQICNVSLEWLITGESQIPGIYLEHDGCNRCSEAFKNGIRFAASLLNVIVASLYKSSDDKNELIELFKINSEFPEDLSLDPAQIKEVIYGIISGFEGNKNKGEK